MEPETSTVFSVNPTALQDIEVVDGAVTGTLLYYDGSGWDAGTWSEDEKAGHFAALKFSVDDGATVTVELEGGKHGPVTLDSDMNVVVRITSTSQAIKATATKGDTTQTEVYKLKGLTLAEEA